MEKVTNETQKKVNIPFKGKKLAYGMESTLYMCPECGQINTLKSDDTTIKCKCGLQYTYNEYGYLIDKNGNQKTITEWDFWQRKELTKLINSSDSGSKLFSDEIIIRSIDKNHQISGEEHGGMECYPDRINCCGKDFYFSDMQGFSIISRNVIVMHTGDNLDQYEIRGNITFNALKYLYAYENSKGVEL